MNSNPYNKLMLGWVIEHVGVLIITEGPYGSGKSAVSLIWDFIDLSQSSVTGR